ncbi:hypothetical protein JXB27_03800 [Candidatus Woesearchaeota archaeon]|nr:hypothetical protein [Candidatus Woesearchaeota archaeon]
MDLTETETKILEQMVENSGGADVDLLVVFVHLTKEEIRNSLKNLEKKKYVRQSTIRPEIFLITEEGKNHLKKIGWLGS